MVDFGDKLFVIGGNNKTNGARRLLFYIYYLYHKLMIINP